MIYNGSQKKMIKIKNPGSKFFEEAYFILREDFAENDSDIKDMVDEANRIIDNMQKRKKKSSNPYLPLYIISAFAVCISIISVIILLVR